MELNELRGKCESWDDDIGCLADYPEDCPLAKECKKDAEED